MSTFFGRRIRRGARTAQPAGGGDTSSTSASGAGQTEPVQYPGIFSQSAKSVKPGGAEMEGLRVLMEPIRLQTGSASGSESKPTQSGWRKFVSTGVSGLKLSVRQKQTDSPFLDSLNREVSASVNELRSSLQRQAYGPQAIWTARKMPRLWQIRKKFHHHSGEWKHTERSEYYDDCECCGQAQHHIQPEYWSRYCTVCHAYESCGKIPATRKGRFSWTGRKGA